MKKPSLILFSLITATLMFLTARNLLLHEESSTTYRELHNQLHISSDKFKLTKITPNIDKLGINVELTLTTNQITADNIKPSLFNNFLNSAFQINLCNGNKIHSELNKFTSNNHYIQIFINDYKNHNITNFNIDSNFCRHNEHADNFLKLISKQKNQGYFEEEYLSTIAFVGKMEKLTYAYNDELKLVDMTAGPGSQFNYIFNYQPKETKTSKEIKEFGANSLYEIVNSYCDTARFHDFSQKVIFTNFIFTQNGQKFVSKPVKKGCQILPSTEQDYELEYKQKKQGYYDEEYLSKVIVPNKKKNFPITYNSELRMVDLTSGPGSQLHFIIVYKPKKSVTVTKLNTTGENILKSIINSVCNNSSFKSLSKNVDLITYHFTLDGKDVLTKSIKKGCQIN